MGGAELIALTGSARPRPRHWSAARQGAGAPWWLSLVAVAACSALVWLMAYAVVLPLVRGWTPTVVLSGSMAPAINTGDVVVMAPYRPADVDVGDVIAFEEPSSGRSVVHRVVARTPDGHYITRGDANAVDDSTSIDPRLVHGVGRVVVPYVGLPVVWATNGAWGHLLALAGVAVVLSWSAPGVVGWRKSSPAPSVARPPDHGAEPLMAHPPVHEAGPSEAPGPQPSIPTVLTGSRLITGPVDPVRR